MTYQKRLKPSTAEKITTLKFIAEGVTGVAGGQKLKNHTTIKNVQANALLAIPRIPGICHLPHTRLSGPICSPDSAFDLMYPVERRQSSSAQHIRYEA